MPRVRIRAATRLWVRGTLFGLKHIVGLTYVERGRDVIPSQPCLIVCNHQSMWGTLAFLVLIPDVAIIAKRELLRIPILSWYLKESRMIVIDREKGAGALKRMVVQSRAALAEGRSVLIFPEGTRMKETDPIRFKRGVELLYVALGTSVLPVAVNSGKFWGLNKACKQRGRIIVSYMPPIAPGLVAEEFAKTAEFIIQTERLNQAQSSCDEPAGPRRFWLSGPKPRHVNG
jgi:1-acyl-sn-glycerol-3-phosphate acyltransferase